MTPLIDPSALVRLQDECVARWHREPVDNPEQHPLLCVAMENHAFNYRLWHEEDEARDPKADDATIAGVKRRIDKLNQQRNDAMERLDEAILSQLPQQGTGDDTRLPLNSETVGSVCDRLSILSLKLFHMREQTERQDASQAHREGCEAKLAVLRVQQADLAACLGELLTDLQAGRKRFRVYRQMKMYNDPTLNPALYGRKA